MGKGIKVFRTRDRMRKKFLFGFILLFSMTALNSGSYLYASDRAEEGALILHAEGAQHYQKGSKENNEKAIQFFRKSIERNNRFAPAYIGLAICYTNKVNYGWDEKLEWLDKAEDLLEKANALSPGASEYYHTLIKVYVLKYMIFDQETGNLAFKLAEKAIRKYPNLPKIMSMASYCFFLKFGETGKQESFNKALELKEKVYKYDIFAKGNMVLTEMLLLNKDFERALRLCGDLRHFEPPEDVNSRLGQIYYYSGELVGGEFLFKIFEIEAPLRFKAFALEHLGMIAAQKGDKDQARQILQDIDTLSIKSFGRQLRMASILMGIGEEEQGFELLDAFFKEPYTQKMRYVYKKYMDLDRNFDKVRDKIRRRYYEPKAKD